MCHLILHPRGLINAIHFLLNLKRAKVARNLKRKKDEEQDRGQEEDDEEERWKVKRRKMKKGEE